MAGRNENKLREVRQLIAADEADQIPIVLADSNAGQTVTANTEAHDYEDEITDTHNAWSTNGFTAPRTGVYNVCALGDADSTSGNRLTIAIDGTRYISGSDRNPTANDGGIVSSGIPLNVGEVLSIRTTITVTRTTANQRNIISITEQ